MLFVKGESAKERLEKSPLNTIAVRTTLGAFYIVPDVTPEMFKELMLRIDELTDSQSDVGSLVLRNVSDAVLVIPFRIVEVLFLVSVNKDDKVHSSSPLGGMAMLWHKNLCRHDGGEDA